MDLWKLNKIEDGSLLISLSMLVLLIMVGGLFVIKKYISDSSTFLIIKNRLSD